MPTYGNIAIPQFSWHKAHTRPGIGVLDPEQFLRQPETEFPVKPLDIRRRNRKFPEIFTMVNQSLDLDVRPCFALQNALLLVLRVIVLQRGINVARMRIMTLDQIRVVAIH